MQKRVLVIGARGFIGSALVPVLEAHGHHVTAASRGTLFAAGPADWRRLDATDPRALQASLAGIDVVVNAMGGPPRSIARVAANLADALREYPRLRLVQFGSLAVFGQQEGVLDETTMPEPALLHRYAAAHLRAENLLFGPTPGRWRGGSGGNISERCLLLRLGCVYGPGGRQWVDRLCRLLQAGRLGDLGAAGAGLAPLIHVRDVAYATTLFLQRGDRFIHHLLAPAPPSWNRYFTMLAAGIGAPPPAPMGRARLAAEIWLHGPARAAAAALAGRHTDRISPSMARLFASTASFASHGLLAPRLPRAVELQTGINESAAAFLAGERTRHWLISNSPGLPA